MEAEELNDFFRPMKPEDIDEMVDSPAFQSLPEYIREQWDSAKVLPDGRRWYVWIGSNGNPHEQTMRLNEFMERATEQAEMNAKGLFRACEVTHLVSRHKKMDSAETKEFMRGLQMAVKVGELPFVRCGSDFAYQPDENEKLHSWHYFHREDLDVWLSKIGYGYTLPLPETQAGNLPPQPAPVAPPEAVLMPAQAQQSPLDTPAPELTPATPAHVVKPKTKRRTWREVSGHYIVEVMQAGQYATAKDLYRALEAKAGPNSPFDKGTGDNRGSLFVREIAQSLKVKTVQNAWKNLLIQALK